MKILYLTFLESVIHNGIYETQVKQLLCDLAAQHSGKMSVSHYAFLPAAEIGRKGVTVYSVDPRRKLEALRQEYLRHGVDGRCIFLPMLILRRWGQSLPFMSLAIALAFPVLLYRVLRQRYDIIHCRSYPATVLAVLLKIFLRNVKVVFDPRGFFPEEGVVTGKWRNGSLTFKLWKRLESCLLQRSDKVVALSESFAERVSTIATEAQTTVIYACADLEQFRQARPSRSLKRQQLGLDGKTVFVYNGSLHAWHDPRLLARLFVSIKWQLTDTKLLVITRHDKREVERLFRENGLQEDFIIVAAEPNDVPEYLAAGDYGMVPLREISGDDAFRIVADTMIGLKVTEYLASGLPLIVNNDVRGIKPLLDQFRIGASFDSGKLDEVVPAIRHMIDHRQQYEADSLLVAEKLLSLEHATKSYYQLYQQLLQPSQENDCSVYEPTAGKAVEGRICSHLNSH